MADEHLVPPDPLNVAWLGYYGNLSDRDADMLSGRQKNGESIESGFTVKRAGRWCSSFQLVDVGLLEREYRFYTEIAGMAARAEEQSCKQEPPSPSSSPNWKGAGSSPSNRGVNTVLSSSKSLQELPSMKDQPSEAKKTFIGSVNDFSKYRSSGLDGRYEVLRPRVSVYTAPSTRASLLGVVHRYSFVRGLAFSADNGEPWLLLHEDTMDDLKMNRPGAFVPITGKDLGGGRDLLKRTPGAPGPSRNEWRTSLSEIAVHEDSKPAAQPVFERWRRFIQRLTNRSLRLPRCLAASYRNHWSTFVLLLEQLSSPEWETADPITGCSLDQAAGAVISLAGLHNSFASEGKLAALPWLPTMALRRESAGQMQEAYNVCFDQCCDELIALMSPSAFDVCRRLCNCYSTLMAHMSRLPVTLLHGFFQPAALRFSTATRPHAVAAYDWQFVCRGRGAYDFAMFLALCGPPEFRRDCQMDLMMRYLLARNLIGPDERDEFREDIRYGLLFAFCFFLMNWSSGLLAEEGAAADQAKRYTYWFGVTIDDWDCEKCVGGTGASKSPKPKRKYMKKSRRK